MIKRKLKPCKTCGDPSYIFSHGDCKSCAQMRYASEKPKHRPLAQTENGGEAKPFKVTYQTKEIKKVSTRQQRLNAAYSVLRKQFLKVHQMCEAHWEGCTYQATTIHHSQGRQDGNLLNDRTFKALCMSCHEKVERQVERAKKEGLTVDRLKISA